MIVRLVLKFYRIGYKFLRTARICAFVRNGIDFNTEMLDYPRILTVFVSLLLRDKI